MTAVRRDNVIEGLLESMQSNYLGRVTFLSDNRAELERVPEETIGAIRGFLAA